MKGERRSEGVSEGGRQEGSEGRREGGREGGREVGRAREGQSWCFLSLCMLNTTQACKDRA